MADSPTLIGQTASHLRNIKRLGAGAMGVVFKAEDREIGRLLHSSFLPDDLAKNSQALERFRREARAASALNHPKHLHEIAEYDGAIGRKESRK